MHVFKLILPPNEKTGSSETLFSWTVSPVNSEIKVRVHLYAPVILKPIPTL